MRYFAMLNIFIALAGCATPQIIEKPYGPEQILHISQYRALKALTDINQHVFYLNPGDTIPLKLEIKGEVIHLDRSQVDLNVKQKLFFRIELSENITQDDVDKILALIPERLSGMTPEEKEDLFKDIMIFISLDGIRWAPFSDSAAIQAVLGIEGGAANFGMAISQTEGLWSLLSLELHGRTN